MEKQKNKKERSFELRSEKVRSIVGQIPSSLVRYGITAIGVVFGNGYHTQNGKHTNHTSGQYGYNHLIEVR